MNLLSRKIVIAGISAAVALSGGFIGQAPRADAAAASAVTDAATAPTVTDAAMAPTVTDAATAPTVTDAATAPTVTDAVTAPTVTDTAAAPALADQGSKAIAIGKRFLGTPYKFGAASGSTRSFDCSSFTQYVFKQIGINLARGARGQYTNGVKIPRSELQVGDLVFFSTTATVKNPASNTLKRIGHVGIYAGDNKVLHTYGAGGVKISNMASGWWDNHYVAAARYIGV